MCIECFNKLPHLYKEGKEYIVWLKDDYCFVCFSEIPDIRNKEINKNVMTEKEIKRAKEKPLYLKSAVDVLLTDNKKHSTVAGGCQPPALTLAHAHKTYTFTIPSLYDYDGASIARLFWRLIGSKENIEFKVAALVHDYLCENHKVVDNDRYFADKVFERLLEAGDVCAFKRWVMFHSVDNFQKICGGWNK